jgi:hypothetical protein
MKATETEAWVRYYVEIYIKYKNAKMRERKKREQKQRETFRLYLVYSLCKIILHNSIFIERQ